jgi:hypothetical protein
MLRISCRAIRPITLSALAVVLVGSPRVVAAQDVPPENLPIGRYVADARINFPKLKQDLAIATAIGVTELNLPARAFGFVVGAHWDPARLGIVTFGIGGEIVTARRGHTLDTGTETTPVNVTVNSRFSAISPQISFNVGSRDGWSYICG